MTNRIFLKIGLVLIIWAMLLSTTSFAQDNDLPQISNTYALTNANVQVKPGQLLENVTLVVKDGLIQSVGKNANIPIEAQVLKADSMYIYAGFISGLSHAGIAKPDNKDQKRPKVPSHATNQQAGITPELSAAKMVSVKDKSLSDFRKNGFTMAHTVPHGRMLPGTGALILTDGTSDDDLVVLEDVSMFGQLKGSQGAYPATVIGVMAKWRELFTQAKLSSQHESQYKSNSRDKKRPNYDDATRALYPVVNGQMPMVIIAEDTRTLDRVLTLQKELGFPLIPAEMRQGDAAISKAKMQSMPVLLSAKLPKEEKEKEDKKEDDKESDDTKKEEKDEELEAMKTRKMKATQQYLGQASRFEKAGIPFAFSMINVKPKEMKKNINRMIEAGLSENAALAALTTNPAQILKVQNQVGTIEKGKIANLIVSTQPFFNEKSQIKYVFVEGRKHEYETKSKKKKSKKEGDSDEKAVDIAGKWSFSVSTPGGDQSGVMVFTKTDENTYSLETWTDDDPTDVDTQDDIEVDGNSIQFSLPIDAGDMEMVIDFDLSFEEDSFEGTATLGQFGSFPMTGSMVEKPN